RSADAGAVASSRTITGRSTRRRETLFDFTWPSRTGRSSVRRLPGLRSYRREVRAVAAACRFAHPAPPPGGRDGAARDEESGPLSRARGLPDRGREAVRERAAEDVRGGCSPLRRRGALAHRVARPYRDDRDPAARRARALVGPDGASAGAVHRR